MPRSEVNFGPVGAEGRRALRLDMQRLWLTGRVLPVGAHLTVQHIFQSGELKPLEVIYSFPMPRDAALKSFRITGDGFEVQSDLVETEAAVKAYERGIAEGSLAAMARQYGDGMINLTVGNVRPGETVTVDLELLAGVELSDSGLRFRFPFTLAPVYHPRMKAARVSENQVEMELPADEFGDVLLPPFRTDAESLHQVGFDLAVSGDVEEVGSPSHAIRASRNGRVTLASEVDVPNRDLVLDVRFQKMAAQVFSGPVADNTTSFAALIPSTLFGEAPKQPRRTVIVLDRSGSMQGAPMEQAKKAIEACLAILGTEDSFGLVAFDTAIEGLHTELLAGSTENRARAHEFLNRIEARGGTALAAGFAHAAQLLNGAGGDIFILTDGQVAGTEGILAHARATNIRLFCLGIGSASQDRFLSLLSRETGGLSKFVTPRERVDLPAVDLFASMGQRAATGLKAGGNMAPEPPTVVFAGNPVLLFGEIDANSGEIEISWDSGRMTVPIPQGDPRTGQTIRLLQGSRLIADWECRYASEQALAPLEKRKQTRIAQQLVELSRKYGLASREMSLVAVVKRAGDRQGEIPETRIVPLGVPQDVNVNAYLPAPPLMAFARRSAPIGQAPVDAKSGFGDMLSMFLKKRSPQPSPASSATSTEDLLLDLASELQPDGGMPGAEHSERVTRSIAALLALVSAGNTLTTGAFRSHVARLAEFLKAASVADRKPIEVALAAALSGKVPPGHWLAIARTPGVPWRKLEKALAV